MQSRTWLQIEQTEAHGGLRGGNLTITGQWFHALRRFLCELDTPITPDKLLEQMEVRCVPQSLAAIYLDENYDMLLTAASPPALLPAGWTESTGIRTMVGQFRSAMTALNIVPLT